VRYTAEELGRGLDYVSLFVPQQIAAFQDLNVLHLFHGGNGAPCLFLKDVHHAPGKLGGILRSAGACGHQRLVDGSHDLLGVERGDGAVALADLGDSLSLHLHPF
jgi:hypothetical protein